MHRISSCLALFFSVSLVLGSDVFAEPVTYYGGPVVSNAAVVMVHWSSDTSGNQAAMPAFYADIVQSDYWTILEQYATPTTPSQAIGLGTFGGTYTLPQAGCADFCAVSDSDLRSYLTSLINSNDPSLPPLVTDSSGLPNTLFVVHFAQNIQVQIPNGSEVLVSCVDFAITYENIQADAAHGNLLLTIGIVPDCGLSETPAASAVLAGMVTDPAYSVAPGWLSNQGFDVGFICSDQTATITAGGHSYEVVPLWSNSYNGCVSTEKIFANGFE
jgi:hypothetical protein